MTASRGHLRAHSALLSATATHEDQPSRPHGRWRRLIVQKYHHLSPVAACWHKSQRETAASQGWQGGAAARRCWMRSRAHLEQPALSAVGGACLHASNL